MTIMTRRMSADWIPPTRPRSVLYLSRCPKMWETLCRDLKVMMNVTEIDRMCDKLRIVALCYTLPTASKSHRSKQLLRSPPRFSRRGSQHPAALPKEQQSRYLGIWGGCIESAYWSRCCMMPTWCCMLHESRMLGASWESVHQFKHQTAHTSWGNFFFRRP